MESFMATMETAFKQHGADMKFVADFASYGQIWKGIKKGATVHGTAIHVIQLLALDTIIPNAICAVTGMAAMKTVH